MATPEEIYVRKEQNKVIAPEDSLASNKIKERTAKKVNERLEEILEKTFAEEAFENKLNRKVSSCVNSFFRKEFAIADDWKHQDEPVGTKSKEIYEKMNKSKQLDKAITNSLNEIFEQKGGTIEKKVLTTVRRYISSDKFVKNLNERLDELIDSLLSEYLERKDTRAKIQELIEQRVFKAIEKGKFTL